MLKGIVGNGELSKNTEMLLHILNQSTIRKIVGQK